MEAKQQSVILKIGSDYYSLTPAEKRLADFILANQEKVTQLSISELARASSVAEATVSRFSRHMGYKSFPLLKLAVANAMAQARLGDTPLSGQVAPQDDLTTMAQKLYRANTEAMMQTMEVLDLNVVSQVASLFQEARQVLCMGQGGSMLIAREAAHLFSTVSNQFRPVEDSHMQAMAAAIMDPRDVLFFFSYSGSTRDVLEISGIARDRGAKIVLVTRFPNSPGAQIADFVLQCGANESPMQSGSIAARVAQMYLLDVLFSEFSRRDLDRARNYRRRIAEALKSKHT
ncbi:MAG: MurR/RpiR family transcriptional regulator [Candidatus Faecousia sp.]|nr:MurR/RpiR family transcriptional regulator [Candidatus Faecousia sp.]